MIRGKWNERRPRTRVACVDGLRKGIDALRGGVLEGRRRRQPGGGRPGASRGGREGRGCCLLHPRRCEKVHRGQRNKRINFPSFTPRLPHQTGARCESPDPPSSDVTPSLFQPYPACFGLVPPRRRALPKIFRAEIAASVVVCARRRPCLERAGSLHSTLFYGTPQTHPIRRRSPHARPIQVRPTLARVG